jgi:NADPH-dependent ferric siderophore reductase
VASGAGGRRVGFRAATGTVIEIEPMARRMRRIRIEGDSVGRLAWIPGQHLRVHVTDMSNPRNWLRPRDLLRTYSVWDRDADGIELCVLDHDGTAGPGARWARSLSVGDSVTVGGPEGHFVLGDGAYHVFAGEETAAVAFGAMLRAVPSDVPVYGVVEVDEPGDQLPIPASWTGSTGTASPPSPRRPCWRPSPGSRCRPIRGSPTWRARRGRFNCSAATSSATAAGRGRRSG